MLTVPVVDWARQFAADKTRRVVSSISLIVIERGIVVSSEKE